MRQQRGLTGLNTAIELHYTGTFEELQSSSTAIEQRLYGSGTDVLNLTLGATAYFGNRVSLSTGVTAPLRDSLSDSALPILRDIKTDRRFDWGIVSNLNVYF